MQVQMQMQVLVVNVVFTSQLQILARGPGPRPGPGRAPVPLASGTNERRRSQHVGSRARTGSAASKPDAVTVVQPVSLVVSPPLLSSFLSLSLSLSVFLLVSASALVSPPHDSASVNVNHSISHNPDVKVTPHSLTHFILRNSIPGSPLSNRIFQDY